MTATSPHPHRTRFERTRTGCLTCRRRRKKCDELKPVCKACHRNNFQCVWPETSIPVVSRDAPSPHHQSSQSESSPDDFDSSEPETQHSASGTELVPVNASPCDFDFAESLSDSDSYVQARCDRYPLNRSMGYAVSPFQSEFSAKLLQHYLAKTASSISTNVGAANPFITSIVPVAFVDDLVMNAVLALSGVDFNNTQPASYQLQTTAWRHYESVIKGLMTCCSEVSTLPCKDALRILLTLMLLCHIEAVSGNTASNMYAHMRAARQIVLYIHANEGELEARDHDYQNLRNFCYEIYVYIALVSHITPYGLIEGRPDALQRDDPVFQYLTGLEDNEIPGSLLSCAYKLFPLIPQISSLARQRLIEEETDTCSAQSVSMYEDLLGEIESWKSPKPHPSMAEYAAAHVKAGEIYRNALLIYLAVSMQPARAKRRGFVDGYIQARIDVVTMLIRSLLPAPHETIMLWPTMIFGSCLLKDRQKQQTQKTLTHSKWMEHGNFARGVQLLQLVWNDPDEDVYGPYGLYLMMKKHDLDPCIA